MANRVIVSLHRAVGVLDVAVRILGGGGETMSCDKSKATASKASRSCALRGKRSEVELLWFCC